MHSKKSALKIIAGRKRKRFGTEYNFILIKLGWALNTRVEKAAVNISDMWRTQMKACEKGVMLGR